MKAEYRLDDMEDRNVIRHSGRKTPPAGASVWALVAGCLTGGGRSHYISRPTYVCPHILVRGRGTVHTAEGEQRVGIGDMFSLMPGTRVEYAEDPKHRWEFLWVHVVGEGAVDWAHACGFSDATPWLRPANPGSATVCMRSIQELLKAGRNVRPYRVVSQLYGLADAARGEPARQPLPHHSVLVEQAQVLIEAQLHTGINIDEVARALQVHRTTLLHAFRKTPHASPVAYLRRARVERAKQLLSDANVKLARVAREAGFANEKYFSRAFRELEGCPPRRWQEQERQDKRESSTRGGRRGSG